MAKIIKIYSTSVLLEDIFGNICLIKRYKETDAYISKPSALAWQAMIGKSILQPRFQNVINKLSYEIWEADLLKTLKDPYLPKKI